MDQTAIRDRILSTLLARNTPLGLPEITSQAIPRNVPTGTVERVLGTMHERGLVCKVVLDGPNGNKAHTLIDITAAGRKMANHGVV